MKKRYYKKTEKDLNKLPKSDTLETPEIIEADNFTQVKKTVLLKSDD